MKNIKKIGVLSLLLLSLLSPAAHAQSTNTQGSGLGTSILVAGSVTDLASHLVVQGVKNTGQFLSEQGSLFVGSVAAAGTQSVLTIRSASGALVATVSVAAGSVAAGSNLVGQSIKVVAEASGYAVYAASQLIAFIPNEMAAQLLHHSQIKN